MGIMLTEPRDLELFEALFSRCATMPRTAVICGSGILSAFDSATVLAEQTLSSMSGYPVPKQKGHAPIVRVIDFDGTPVLLFGGRCHLYEGYSAREVTAQVELTAQLGIKNLVQTNAVGGIDASLEVGDLVMVDDVIDLTFGSGDLLLANQDVIHHAVIDSSWYRNVWDSLKNVEFLKRGVYIQVTGPNYETPAEIEFFRRIGASCVGMSTALEGKHAARLGLNQIVLSVVTNVYSSQHRGKVTHSSVVDQGKKAAPNIQLAMRQIIADAPNY
jgi:purine-nucleoside phosphorylase